MSHFPWPTLKNIYWRKSVVSVFVLVGLWNLLILSHALQKVSSGKGFWRETIADLRQVNMRLQLRFYNVLSGWRADPFDPKRIVTLVMIDNKTHWTKLWGDEPTDRSYLAQLITNASQPTTKASVIVLDVQLLTPGKRPPGTDKPERKDRWENGKPPPNRQLVDAINFATSQGIPVVLTTSSVLEGDQQVRLPNIYDDSELPLREPNGGGCNHPACAVFGYVDSPDDWRTIPLTKRMLEWDGSGNRDFESLSFAAVNAWEGKHQTTRNYPLVRDALQNGTPLFGSFVDESRFDSIPVELLAAADPGAESDCSRRIVLIGGRWRADQGYGALVDAHFSPAGEISGVAFHANYIESLFSHALATEVPVEIGIVIDVIIGLIIYAAFESSTGWQRPAVLLVAFLLPPAAAYLFLVTKNLYLDFLLPSELYFLHLLYEFVL